MGDGQVHQDLKDGGAERALLRTWLTDAGAFASTGDFIEAHHFTHVGAQAVARAIINLSVTGRAMDEVIIAHNAAGDLTSQGVSDAQTLIGNTLAAIKAAKAHPSNADEYGRAVRRMADLRAIKSHAQELAMQVTADANPNALAAASMDAMLATATGGKNTKTTLSFGDLIAKHHAQLAEELALMKSGKPVGLMTDFSPWDTQTHGMRDGELYVVAGEPGSGKTVMLMNLLRTGAIRERSEHVDPASRRGFMFQSLEMGDGTTAMRWEQMALGYTTPMIRGKELDETVLAGVAQLVADEGDLPLYANFSTGMYADQMKAVIANAVREHNVRVVVIDHLRYVKMRNEPRDLNERDEQRVQYIHDEICKALGVTVILITHSTKAAENRDDKKPRMADLRGSGMISAQADGICFMWRPWMTCTQAEREANVYSPHEAYLVWVKNRVNDTKPIPFSFDGTTMKFIDAAAVGRAQSQRSSLPDDQPSPAPVQAAMALDTAGDDEW